MREVFVLALLAIGFPLNISDLAAAQTPPGNPAGLLGELGRGAKYK